MSLKDIIDPLTAALKTRDGGEVHGQRLGISERELQSIYEAYAKPPGWAERAMGGFTAEIVRSQLQIIKDGLKISGGVIDDDARAQHQADVAQLESLLDFLETVHGEGRRLPPRELYQRYLAMVASRLDG